MVVRKKNNSLNKNSFFHIFGTSMSLIILELERGITPLKILVSSTNKTFNNITGSGDKYDFNLNHTAENCSYSVT